MHVVCLLPTHDSFTYTQQNVYKYMPHAFKHIIHFIHCNIFYFPRKGIVATTYVLNPVHKIMLQPLRKLQDQEAQSKMLKHNHNRTYQNSQGRLLPRKNLIHLKKPIYLQCSHQGYLWHPLEDHRCKELTTADFHPVKTFKQVWIFTSSHWDHHQKGMSVHLHNELSELLNEYTIKYIPKYARNIKCKSTYCIYSNKHWFCMSDNFHPSHLQIKKKIPTKQWLLSQEVIIQPSFR